MGKRASSKSRDNKKAEGKAKAKAGKSQHVAESPLKRSFMQKPKKTASPKAAAAEAAAQQQPRKIMTSNFLSYIRCAQKAQDPAVVEQAVFIADQCQSWVGREASYHRWILQRLS